MTERIDTNQLARSTIAVVLAGGRGSRLKQLTNKRSKPAVFFGGKFRIIDFALSNCVNSGIRRIAVATQYKSHSLLRHLQRGWNFLRAEMNEYVDLLPAQQRTSDNTWYQGTADAVFQNLDILRSERPKYIMVLAGDHIYKMDYSKTLAYHVDSGADCTVGCIEAPLEDAKGFGVMAVNDQMRITDFVEKPANPPAMPDNPDRALASMGIYVFNADYLFDMLEQDARDPESSHDFGKDIIPRIVASGGAVAQPFSQACVGCGPGEEPYWRDVGTIDAYWEANIALTDVFPALNVYDRSWPIWTYQEQLPPAKFVKNESVEQSVVSGGCIVSGSDLKRSLVFSKCEAHAGSVIHDSILLPSVYVEEGARLTKTVVDRGVHIPANLVVGEDPEADARRFERTEKGVTLITKEMLREAGY
jgi:glucose-1-phosphate adenylyltransferase